MISDSEQRLPAFQNALPLSDDDWIAFLAGQGPVIEGVAPPAMPDSQIQESFVGSSGEAAMSEAGMFYSQVMAILRDAHFSERSIGRVLDFGCGWGRIYRTFLRHCQPGSLVGTDIDEGCIAICGEAMPYGTFVTCEPMPPLRFEHNSYDVILAYSVFSHLVEDAFRAWVAEFARLLRPRGFLFFTTLKVEHLAVWGQLAKTGNEHYKRALVAAGFTSPRKWRARAKRGEFLFVPTGGGGVRESTFYGEAVVSPAYLEMHARHLGFTQVALSTNTLPQAFVALQRTG